MPHFANKLVSGLHKAGVLRQKRSLVDALHAKRLPRRVRLAHRLPRSLLLRPDPTLHHRLAKDSAVGKASRASYRRSAQANSRSSRPDPAVRSPDVYGLRRKLSRIGGQLARVTTRVDVAMAAQR